VSHPNFSRRLFLSGAAAVPALAGQNSIAEFPVPDRVRIVTAASSYVVPPPQLSPAEIQQIRSAGKNVELTVPANREELERLLPEADVIFGSVNPEMYAKAKKLRWLQATEAGMDKLLFPQLIDSSVVVTNMQRVFAPAISETAIGMLLSLTRGFNRYFFPQFQQRKWEFHQDLVEVDGMTMGLVGLGGLGSATAQRAHYGFNMKILAVDPKPMPKPAYVDTLREPQWLTEMVPQVDVLVSAAPATRRTEAMFNEKVFRAMKKTAYFINISRGTLVDEPALVRALKEGWIAGAGIDVAREEPLPSSHAFWDCPNLIITCHTAGFSPQRRIRLIALLAENVRRYSNGLPLMNVVDKQRGY
jgi:phosphoglycerate dehydrogenase-like enzyme